ncbi:MAG: hypothetical protein LAP40_16055 [Acidobacteriia bacterium]|nr:hypothetical protein [Terriglobia bacterium]
MKSIRILLALTALVVVLIAAEPLTNENIIKMVQAGVPSEIVIKTIRSTDAFQFGLLPGDLIALGQAKVPEEIIKAMALRLNGVPPVAAAPVQTNPLEPQQIGSAVPTPRIAERPRFATGGANQQKARPASEGFTSEIHRAEIFGGYSYANADNSDGTRSSFNGWESSALVNVNNLFGVEGDVSGYYKTALNVPGFGAGYHDYILAAGPRISFRPVFFHALFGVDRLTEGASFSGSGYSVSGSLSQNSLAAVFGGGVQVRIARNWALRPSVDYVLTRHGLPSRVTQNNIRVGGGIVYGFGGM